LRRKYDTRNTKHAARSHSSSVNSPLAQQAKESGDARTIEAFSSCVQDRCHTHCRSQTMPDEIRAAAERHTALVLSFTEVGLGDVALVGGKNASLGEMVRSLDDIGIRVPGGFAVTAEAFRQFIHHNDLGETIATILAAMDKNDLSEFHRRAAEIRRLVETASWPAALRDAVLAAYRDLETEYGSSVAVAVRSSATAEDLPTASFAGQHDTYLSIQGGDEVLDAVRRCFASLYTDRAISYRIDNGFAHEKVALSVGVQKMVRSDQSASGVMFSIDTESGFRDAVLITGVYGLGETIVQGIANPDEFVVHKPTLAQGFRPLVKRRLGAKQVRMVLGRDRRHATVTEPTPAADQGQFCISDDEVLELARHAAAIEAHYSKQNARPTPMDIEWAKDGPDGRLFIVQARPETVQSQANANLIRRYTLSAHDAPIATGLAIGGGVASGTVKIIRDAAELNLVGDGDILVAEITAPDWEPVMKRVAGIVTVNGGRTCHAAIVAREIGIPAIVGVGDAMSILRDGEVITISCAEGETGRLYRGAVPFSVEEIDASDVKPSNVKVMINLGNPERAFSMSFLPVDGVGLARLEFIVSEYVRAHPMALLAPSRVSDKRQRAAIEEAIDSYPNGGAYFIDKLAEGVGMIAAGFYPRPVIVRMTDFKSNEYANLIGGADFEFSESNPMIGFRGASRYTHPSYRPAFDLECQALRRVRETFGLTNLKIMVPFCRTLAEADATLAAMEENGLKRGVDGLEVYVMCEIPSNVLLIDEFAKRFDGFSIGSNDLTQLTLGVDRDSAILSASFDERDPAVMKLIEEAIKGAHRNGRVCGICGQAPSDFPDFARWLVAQQIDSISLNPDAVFPTMKALRG
jgi:pyruvate,water dikinase